MKNEKSNIILIGMPGVGKSTVGLILAKGLGYDFIDVDLLIAKKQGTPLQEIIDAQGIDAFLAIENEVGRTLKAEQTVLAPGGSIVFSEAAMENLKRLGPCIYLKLPIDQLEARIAHNKDSRGIVGAPNATIGDIFEIRRPLYERYADFTIDCDGKEPEEVAEAVLAAIEALSGGTCP